MACTHCRDRKVKCDNNNDGLPCKRCKKNEKDCRYEPVNPIGDPQQSSPPQGEPPITGDKPIMTVYQGSPPPPTSIQPQWPEVSDPHLRSFSDGRPLHPYDPMPAPPPLTFQPPHAYPQGQYAVPWQPPFIQPHTTQLFSYGHQGENPYSVSGHGYWIAPRTSNLSNMSNDNSGDRPEDSVGEPSGSS